MVNERELAVIKALTEAKGPSGFEDEAVAAARESLSDICDFEEDSLRNLYIYRRTRAISPYSCLTRTATRWAS